MSYCPHCGSKNRSDARFCDRCGRELNADLGRGVSVNIKVDRPSPTMRDPQIDIEIEELRGVLNDIFASHDSKRAAILRLCELKHQGSSKASTILIRYSRLMTGNAELQRLASNC